MFHPSVTADTRVEGGTQGHAGTTWTNVYTSNITPYIIQLATLQPDFMFSLVQVTSNFVLCRQWSSYSFRSKGHALTENAGASHPCFY